MSHKPIAPGPMPHPMARPSATQPRARPAAAGPKGPKKRTQGLQDEAQAEGLSYSEHNADTLEHDDVHEGRAAQQRPAGAEHAARTERPVPSERHNPTQRQGQADARSPLAHTLQAPAKGLDYRHPVGAKKAEGAERSGTASIAESSQHKLAIASLLNRFDASPALGQAKQAVGGFHAQLQWTQAMGEAKPAASRALIETWMGKHQDSAHMAQARSAFAQFASKVNGE